MGGISVNSLCQQDGLFALSVNRHSVIFIELTKTEQCIFSSKHALHKINWESKPASVIAYFPTSLHIVCEKQYAIRIHSIQSTVCEKYLDDLQLLCVFDGHFMNGSEVKQLM